MKQISLDGRIGKDAEVLQTKGGKSYVRFSLANDSFNNGKNVTEWFDVTSYDPFIVESRVKYLTKGRYIIVHGNLSTEVNTKNGRVYLNQYVTANSIDTPNFGTNRKEEAAPKDEDYSTVSQVNEEANISTGFVASSPKTDPSPTPSPSPAYAYEESGSSDDSGDDDLPF